MVGHKPSNHGRITARDSTPSLRNNVSTLLITSLSMKSGKTSLCGALSLNLLESGYDVHYCKPLAEDTDNDQDTDFITKTVLKDSSKVTPPIGSLPSNITSAESVPLDTVLSRLSELDKERSSEKSVTIIEAPPLSHSNEQVAKISRDFIEACDTRVILVSNLQELPGGTLPKNANIVSDRLLGLIINNVPRYKAKNVVDELAPLLKKNGVSFLGSVPEDRTMMALTVDQIANNLDGQWIIGQNRSNDLVEHFLIGGNVMDWGVDYFHRKKNKAVVVRGNRPDLQLAALSTHSSCLLLTDGSPPTEYVIHEARTRDVPLIKVNMDTITAADALGNLVSLATTHHPRKLERFVELSNHHIDFDKIKFELQ